ncbi:MAG: hypothetical protein JO353_01680 [Phycisphaerae bacterium]|nr:hypothetical protein [Phycisphaerae bacterium]
MTAAVPTSGKDRAVRILSWVVPLVVYIAAAIPIGWRERFQINPDGIIYIRKAQFLLNGHFLQSVSGYWPPGLSWCIAAVLKVARHTDPLSVIHALLLSWGFLWLIACCAFFFTIVPHRPWARMVGGAALALVGVRLAVVWIAPDLLLCTWLIAYLCCWTWPKQSRWTPLLAGTFAGLGYLCKAYALPFFVLHFLGTIAYRWWIGAKPRLDRARRSQAVRTAILGFVGLGIFVVPWAGLLSYKYGKFTISMVYHHNHLNVAPMSYLRSSPDFCLLPPDPYLTIWEGLDPGPRIDWSPWSSRALFVHQIGIAVTHIGSIVGEVFLFDCCALSLIVAVVALLPAAWMRKRRPSQISVWLVLTALAYCTGFLMVAFETRYIVPFLLPIAIALCFSEAERFDFLMGGCLTAAIYCVVAAIDLYPFAFLNPPHPIYQRVASEMRSHGLNQVFSSSQNNNGVNVSWYLNQKIVLVPPQNDIETIERKLRECGVENMIIWIDPRTEARDPYPEQLTKMMRSTHHWELAFSLRLDSERRVFVYHWIGPR